MGFGLGSALSFGTQRNLDHFLEKINNPYCKLIIWQNFFPLKVFNCCFKANWDSIAPDSSVTHEVTVRALKAGAQNITSAIFKYQNVAEGKILNNRTEICTTGGWL